MILPILIIAPQRGLVFGQKKLFPSDTIPKTRLMTTEELLGAIDPSRYPSSLHPMRDALAANDPGRAADLFVRHLKSRTSPGYFFNPKEMSRRADLYAREYPDDHRYGEGVARRFMNQYGTDIDWRTPGSDREGNAHTPNTVRFLARHLYAENLAVLSLVHRDPSFARFQMDMHRDFLRDVEAGRAERGGNDVFERFYGGHRIRNLMMFHQMLLSSPYLTDDDHLLLVKSFLLHGAIIIQKCSSFNWGNHQLVGLCALYEMTSMYPEFPVMTQWNARVWELILEHLRKEVKEDGFQFERASHYFKLDIYNYFRAFRLADVNEQSVPDWARDRFRKMFEAIATVLMPNGAMPPLQDAQDSYVGNRNIDEARKTLGVSETANSAELVDPSEAPFMTLGATLFNDGRFKHFGGRRIHPVFTWFLPEDANARYASLHAIPPTFTSASLPQSGYFVMRGGWDREDAYMIIDGGLAAFKPDHTHGGVLGVIAYAGGDMVLPNYRVRYSDPVYPLMKNSFAKNVSLVDSIVQGRGWVGNAARTGFGKWSWLPTPSVHRWVEGDRVDYFSASHDAFDTVGISYQRTIVFVKPSTWFVVDAFTGGQRKHTYRQIWQGTFRQHSTGWSSSAGRLLLRPLEPENVTGMTATLGETVSLILSAQATGPMTFATLLSASPGEIRARSAGPGSCTFDLDGSSTTIQTNPAGPASGISFEGESIVLTRQGSALVRASVIHGTRFDSDGLEFSSATPASFEVWNEASEGWQGRMTGGESASIRIRTPNGTVLDLEKSGLQSHMIR